MDFFKVKKFTRAGKPNPERDLKEECASLPEEPKDSKREELSKLPDGDPATEVEDDDDDDFIMNEVKKRLKELRRNSFMVLIPEESCPEDEEEEDDDAIPMEWREMETGNHNQLCEFDYVYDKYCQRMLFFDRMSAQHLNEAGNLVSNSCIIHYLF